MEKTYKNLIIITFLIAAFFMARWVWNAWPRYEWQEKIIEKRCSMDSICWGLGGESDCFQQENEGGEVFCYIKEKVRIK